MKKVVSLFIGSLLAATLSFAEDGAKHEGMDKIKGFLTSKWCADRGLFKDCRTEAPVCGYGGCYKDWDVGEPADAQIVVYVHNENRYYTVDTSHMKMYELDEGMNRNDVTIIGDLDKGTNIIVAHEMEAPPPPKKSFFKGCL